VDETTGEVGAEFERVRGDVEQLLVMLRER